MFAFSHRNDFGKDITNLRLYKKWEEVSEKLFEMGEEKGDQDHPPRDMPTVLARKRLP